LGLYGKRTEVFSTGNSTRGYATAYEWWRANRGQHSEHMWQGRQHLTNPKQGEEFRGEGPGDLGVEQIRIWQLLIKGVRGGVDIGAQLLYKLHNCEELSLLRCSLIELS